MVLGEEEPPGLVGGPLGNDTAFGTAILGGGDRLRLGL